MRWQGRRRSSNVEDRRGDTPASGRSGGGAGFLFQLLPFLIRRPKLLAGVAVVAIGAHILGLINIPMLLTGQQDFTEDSGTNPDYVPTEQEQQLAEFVAVVLADTEDTWNTLFMEAGSSYQEPTLVMFTQAVQSACGFAQAAMGPFYCPADNKVYIDLSFYQDLKERHGAPGDFAQAYVIAHEVGHHVQTLIGISSQVNAARQRASETESNQLQVRMELQADCFAGIWAYHADKARQIVESGDVEEALTAAAAIGDDRLQMESRGYVTPEGFTHGTSEQRVRWFRTGMESGEVNSCDTFNAAQL